MAPEPVSLRTVLREWGRIGLIGFGGPPAHVALLRRLCVDERRWLDGRDFEDANAACGLLPGPASTQLAIFCAHRVAGARGAVVGGLAFIVPGLVALLALAVLTLGDDPPAWARGAAAGAGAAVVAVVVEAGVALGRTSVRGVRAAAYVVAGAITAALAGPWVVLVLLGCGLVELVWRRGTPPVLLSVGVLPALVWTAFKVGALSYGGGFVIIPLMRGDAVDQHGWMTEQEFLNAVALGQITPGPVVQTVGGVGYAAAGIGGGLLAAAVAFAPSFLAILLGGRHFERLRKEPRARAFLDGAGPAAVGAILGAAVPLIGGVEEAWQWLVLGLAGVLLLVVRAGIVVVLLGAAVVGALVGALDGPLPPL
ncbi:chromate transporter [Conexibacter sp. SYSU D00693]|uniref:chromate transporter n=1 Tax=Conexibacter sp. SYSU D00693 TaxID=2812560 RepID=UPI00196A20D5|nr:chromate transporter [Conexibacter sp. SYSU D00693]